MYVALVLVMHSLGRVHILIAWLLIIREVAMYALRVLSPEWLEKNTKIRALSLLHAFGIRMWLTMFLVADGMRLGMKIDLLESAAYRVAQHRFLALTILAAYLSILGTARLALQSGDDVDSRYDRRSEP